MSFCLTSLRSLTLAGFLKTGMEGGAQAQEAKLETWVVALASEPEPHFVHILYTWGCMYPCMGFSCHSGRQDRLLATSFWTGQPQASKNGARFFCTFSENFFTHRFILPALSLGMPESVWYSAKSWVNGSHPKASWS